jgi:hypothetical protein
VRPVPRIRKEIKKRTLTDLEKGRERSPVDPFQRISAKPTSTANCQRIAALVRRRPYRKGIPEILGIKISRTPSNPEEIQP